MGLHCAGFAVDGVDRVEQPNYPFTFHKADAVEFIAEHGHRYDLIVAGPPCQKFTAYRRKGHGVGAGYPNLIPDTRDALVAADVPWVIENVEQARRELRSPVMLCGSSFGLDVRRHRLFETSWPVLTPPCDHGWQRPRFPCATNRTNLRSTVEVGVWRIPLPVQQAAMGIDWMTLAELSLAIPPAFSEFLARDLVNRLNEEAAA